jgi:hypothetical protein
MVVREQERGKSECRSVMERIGVETSLHAKAGRHPHGLSSQASLQNHHKGRKANERSNTDVRTFWRDMGRYSLGYSPASGKAAASAYCEGKTQKNKNML